VGTDNSVRLVDCYTFQAFCGGKIHKHRIGNRRITCCHLDHQNRTIVIGTSGGLCLKYYYCQGDLNPRSAGSASLEKKLVAIATYKDVIIAADSKSLMFVNSNYECKGRIELTHTIIFNKILINYEKEVAVVSGEFDVTLFSLEASSFGNILMIQRVFHMSPIKHISWYNGESLLITDSESRTYNLDLEIPDVQSIPTSLPRSEAQLSKHVNSYLAPAAPEISINESLKNPLDPWASPPEDEEKWNKRLQQLGEKMRKFRELKKNNNILDATTLQRSVI